MKALSEKNAGIAASLTLAISAKAKQLQAQGIDVVSFGAGEPDFNTPENIRNAAIERINKGGNGYTPASGLLELKEAICRKLARDNGLEYTSKNIVVSNGAKHSLNNVLMAICNPGDEVLIPGPYWVSYYELVKLADGEPVIVETTAANDFTVTIETLNAALTPKTKAIMINSPNNPTGAVYSEALLRQIGDFAVENDLYIISDEIYEKLIYDEKHVSVASFSEAIKERTIVVNGLSKAYAMTGWRIGYTASNEAIAKIMSNIQSHATSNPNTIAQYAGIEALDGNQDTIETMRRAFDERRQYMVKTIAAMKGITCVNPKGAFYVMMDVSSFYGKKVNNLHIEDSLSFADALLETDRVAVIPGIAFGADQYVRLSYATSMDNIVEGLKRIETFIGKIEA
ncbi:pyridoxal phosphate-dependent aminotransferase [Fusibacter paucivorans]|uniref:Aminotransferase n=1 Tax=Fusibacter paucivorans TaxID=76009 RepID=A0ABS5PNN3_9FIRM|nr:pyridoxal phosphate-dependent aminotransferase [Fusibacter paucivorans]MBS7526661.1 pyridoxal phosphate-dependent aminotransferase [Fusibacter paucivorans]